MRYKNAASQLSRKYQLQRQAKIRAIKLERGCTDCGYNSRPEALDFDHVRGEKKFSVSNCNYSWQKIEEEIAKCDVVCANCHRVRTADRGKT